ncbi:MAG: hypothetical protein LBF08_02820 [Dysgonamonadaceae bacterium]|nr:hypothetical protein [Dysgonamonadaceae bacterium]
MKWKKTNALLGYFVEVANDKLKLKHGDPMKIKPFETLFNVKRLSSIISDYKNKGNQKNECKPYGYEIIAKIFSDLKY